MTPLLSLDGLTKTFPTRRGTVRAVDGIDLQVRAGEALGLVGESGCGKSTTGRMLVRLLDPTAGRITFDGRDITGLSQRRMRPLRRDLQIIFQDPFASLNPRHTVGSIVAAPLRAQGEDDPASRVREMLEFVGLGAEHADRYPHEFSGGQAQRIGIARALVTGPRLVVADEPVSALDVSIQAQIVNLLAGLRRRLGLAYVFIAHDLAVVRHVCDRIAVMYLGRIVEIADRDALYGAPAHPYTRALLSAIPLPDPVAERTRERIVLRGDPPSPSAPPPGCAFHPRCFKAQDRCRVERPPLAPLDGAAGRAAACHFPELGPFA
ncbi:ABC transporter ATP-binding protein [Actinomadura sp. NAK00032]|uniref:ABC transporter ATP-binding protein n=1 Tax=Actinomadura sp. NAK00032 TaxID=2742128 RepID=UPI00158FA21D|nr:ABC transporter ATP-binding protein [Actinomadura sp. NAK00032]QKW38025.1 ABC transporter ATP-binding protein [Actinomadura sp. NAK00032]